jgi:hypothetical protein
VERINVAGKRLDQAIRPGSLIALARTRRLRDGRHGMGENPRMDAQHPSRQKGRHTRVSPERLRLAFLEGAEEHSRATLGRGLTHEELQRIIARFPAEASPR